MATVPRISFFCIMSNNKDRNSFGFFMPVEVSKASKGEDKDRRWIQGIASTYHKDLQGERVVQRGIDFDYFLKHGYINDDHKEGPEHKVGEPTECQLKKDGLFIKGFLYKGKERSDYWWEHLNALQQSDSNRRVGFSIQGKVQRKRGNDIVKCWLQDVAITASPVNTKTWAEIAKALGKESWALKSCECNENPCVCEEKALSAGSAAGGALSVESLEGDSKVQTYKSLTAIPDNAELGRNDCITVLQLDRGWSRPTAAAVVDAIFSEKGIIGG